MKMTLDRIDKFSIFILVVLVIGIVSSFLDFGILSVFFSVIMPLIFIIVCGLAIYGLFKKKYINLIGVLLFLIFYNFFFQISIVKDSETKTSISVLTYNVRAFKYHVSNSPELNASTEIIKFVDSLNADILVFQESPNDDWQKIKGYPYIFLGYREGIKKSLQAIYSKYPIINKGYVDFPDTNNNAMYADIKIHQDTIRIYNSHLQSFIINRYVLADNYKDFSYWKHLNNTNTKQIEQAKLIKNHADASNKKVIICGDFNSTPYSQTYRILKKGMDDSFLTKGNGLGKTFSLLKYPLRLDYFLYDEQIKVFSHDNFTLKLSDHEPAYVKFGIK